MHHLDRDRYNRSAPGSIFRPRHLPAGIWLQVDDFTQSPICDDVYEYLSPWRYSADDIGPSMQEWSSRYTRQMAKGLFFLPASECDCTYRSMGTHEVKRIGFCLTHANYLTATASQGQTLRSGVTIDCARLPKQGGTGLSDDDWWLNLYVMFSRATQMSDMLLLRPPPRELLERGPPDAIREQLRIFSARKAICKARALQHATDFGFPLLAAA